MPTVRPAALHLLALALLSALAASLIAPSATASCGSSSCPLDLHALGLTSSSPFVLDLSFQYIHQDRLMHGTAPGYFGEVATDHNEVSTINRLTTLQGSYLVTPRLQVTATLPFVSRSHEHIAVDAGGTLEQWNFSALGDAAAQARYRVFAGDSAVHNSLWVSAGVKFPTGARHEISRATGAPAEVTIQPGTGSTDVLIGAAWNGGFLHETGLQGLFGSTTVIPYFASVTYRRNGRGTDAYRRGDEVQISVGSEYPLSPRIRLLAQINGRRTSKDDVGATAENPNLTGGRYVFVSPGLRVMLLHGASAYTYVQLPAYQNVNGLQLTSRVNYVVGIQQRF